MTSPIVILEAEAIISDPNATWQRCRDRARIVLTPAVLLMLLFCLTFGVGLAVIGGDDDGWIIVGVVAVASFFVVCFDNLKLWMIVYPLIFIAPRMKLGDWSGGGEEKLFGIQAYEPLMAILVGLWIPRLVARRRLDLPRPLKVSLVALAIIGLNAIRIAPDRMQAIRDAGRLFYEPLLLFVVITSVPWRRTELKAAALTFVFASALVATISVVGYGTHQGGSGPKAGAAVHGPKSTQGQRLESYWEATNSLAAFLVAAAAVSVGAAVSCQSLKGTLLAAGAVPVQVGAVILSFTRGAWLALAASLFVLTLQLRRIGWLLIGTLLLLGALAAAPPEVVDRFQSIASFQSERSAENRIHMWHYAIPLAEERPLTGYGFGGFQVLFSSEPGITSAHAHNFMLDYMLAIGAPGVLMILIVITYVLGGAVRTVFHGLRRSPDIPLLAGLSAGCLGMLGAGMVDGSISVWPILAHSFWFLLALTYSLTLSITPEISYAPMAEEGTRKAA
jgi:O-antigen ligase